MSQKSASKEPLITYFRPGQLVFQVNENLREDEKSPEKIRNVIGWANELAKSEGIGIELSASPKKVFGFNGVESSAQTKELQASAGRPYTSPPIRPQPAFSLIFVDAISQKWPESSTEQDNEESQKDREGKIEALNELLNLVFLLDENREGAKANLDVVSPNWLMSGSPSSPGSTGGPGIRPTPYSGPSNTDEHNFDIMPKIRNENVGGRLDEPIVNTVVAILDTVPTLRADEKVLYTIYDRWVKNVPQGQGHPRDASAASGCGG